MAATSSTRWRITASSVLRRREAEGEVVADAEVGVERVALEDHRDVALARLEVGDVALAEVDGAAADLLEAGEQAQQGGLAAAARADEHGEAAGGDEHVDAAEHLGGAEALLYVADVDFDHRCGLQLRSLGRRRPRGPRRRRRSAG
jgi:hypothetical protein